MTWYFTNYYSSRPSAYKNIIIMWRWFCPSQKIIISWMQACTFVYNHFQNCVRDVFFLPRLCSVVFPSCDWLLIYSVSRHIGNTPSLSHRQFGQANLPPLDLQMLSAHTIVVEMVNVSLGIWFVSTHYCCVFQTLSFTEYIMLRFRVMKNAERAHSINFMFSMYVG